jgi:hypothetical protein
MSSSTLAPFRTKSGPSARAVGSGTIEAATATRAGSPTASAGAAVALLLGTAALVCVVGADSRWLAALGDAIIARHAIPHGIPFAAASTAHWANTLVLAELVFRLLESGLGDRGLMLAQLVALGIGASALARDAFARGATGSGTAAALLIAGFGALPTLGVARVQLFSVLLFPIAIALLRSETRQPTRRIWLIVPLLALWSNLHGAVLIALGITLVYLALERSRHSARTAAGLAVASAAAVSATPAGIHTFAYYSGVLTNQAAAGGKGMWGPLSLSSPLDVVMILAAATLIVRIRKARPAAWELAAVLALVAATALAARSGVWLLFFLAPLAAQGLKPRWLGRRAAVGMAVVGAGSLVLALARGPLPSGASPELIRQALGVAAGRPVLAEDVLAEQVALAGGRVWVSDPIDAFSARDQSAYLAWTDGQRRGLRGSPWASAAVVLTARDSAAQRLVAKSGGFRQLAGDGRALLYISKR